MTRKEHIEWCKQRAIQEMDHSGDPSQAYVSMASDLRKHPETNSESLIQLCVMQMMMPNSTTRQAAIKFLNGFN